MLFAHAFADAQRREGIEPAELKTLSKAMSPPPPPTSRSGRNVEKQDRNAVRPCLRRCTAPRRH